MRTDFELRPACMSTPPPEGALPSDPREQAVQVDDLQFTPLTEDDWEKLAAHEGLYALIQQYGAQRVMSWVRSLAAIAGQEVS